MSASSPKLVLDHDPEAARWLRKHLRLSAAEVAARAGCSASLIRQIETGDRNAGPDMIARLAGVYGCPPVMLERKGGVAPAAVVRALARALDCPVILPADSSAGGRAA